MRYENIKEATRGWQNGFNAFPLGMIEKLFNADVDDWHEITPIAEGCRVWSNEYQDGAEVIEITENEDGEKLQTETKLIILLYVVRFDGGFIND